MANPMLIKNFIAETAVAAFRVVKFGSTDEYVVQGAAVADSLIGVCGAIAGDAGERCDITLVGTTDVELGGTVTRGDLLTVDSSGRAVTAAPAAGVNNNVIGRAMVSGVISDIGSVLISQSRTQG
jgi:hypothetical protein